MVNATVTSKFPAALLTVEDVGVFGNDEGTHLTADIDNDDTVLSLASVSEFEEHQWLALRGVNGFEIVQVDAINLGQKQATVERAKDGTVGVAHTETQQVKSTIPAIALNQLRADLIAAQTKLGTTATSGVEGGILFADASGNFAQDATNLFWHDATNQLRLAATGASAGILIGGDTQLYRGAANKLYLASGDTLHLVSGLLESATTLTLTPASGSNLNLAVAGAGGVQVAGTTVFESDRDLAVSLLPNADATLTLGSASRRYTEAHANTFDVRANAGDAEPTARLVASRLELGAGGATGADFVIQRSGANAGTVSGRFSPGVDDTYDLGNTTQRWQELYTGPLGVKVTNAQNDANSISELNATGLQFGAGGVSALDTTLARQAASVVELTGSLAGSVRYGMTGAATPIVALRAAAADANHIAALLTDRVSIGAGGASAPDYELVRTGANTGTLSGHLLPSVDDTYDLGSASLRWRDLYVGPSIHVVNASGDANDLVRLGGSGLQFGAGGASALDWTLSRTGADVATVAAGDSLAIADLTEGSVLFSGASGVISQDNAGLFFDATDDRLVVSGEVRVPEIEGGTAASSTLTLRSTSGVGSSDAIVFQVGNNGATEAARINTSGLMLFGVTAPVASLASAAPIQIHSANDPFAAARYGANANGPNAFFGKSRNATIGSHTIVQDGDVLGGLLFRGSDGTAFRDGAQIRAEVDGTPGASDMPGRILFLTTPDGSASLAEAGRIKQNKVLQMNSDITIDDGTKGIILKDTQATPHYWRLTVDNTGGLVTTDIGTSAP